MLYHLFGARGRVLYETLGADEVASFLSGLLIGEELEGMAELEPLAETVFLVCGERLREPYEIALSARGIGATWIDARVATLRGVVSVIHRHRSGAGRAGASA